MRIYAGYVMAPSERGSVLSVPYMFYHFSTSGIAVATATAATHPLVVTNGIKDNAQQSKNWSVSSEDAGAPRGLDCDIPHCLGGGFLGKLFVQTMKTEGPRALYLGLGPSLTRSVTYGGLRLGLYEPCKYVCDLTFGSTNILVKIASGAFSGAFATALTNPMEVLKVRLQMNANMGGGGAIGEMRRIVSNGGAKALWKGVGPAMARAAALTASQLATYDESKQKKVALNGQRHLSKELLFGGCILKKGFICISRTLELPIWSSAIAGTVGTLVTAPIDMIKTRLMLQNEPKRVGSYRNGFHCAYKVTLTEGPKALYKGVNKNVQSRPKS
ncbi:hypothetical protein ACLOJK_018057 [Asimina triloba]